MKFDPINLLAIDLLELFGNDCPNQGQIDLAESLISALLSKSKFQNKIANKFYKPGQGGLQNISV